VHRAEELGYHPQVIPDFFTKNRVKTARRVGVCLFLRPKGVTVFGCGAKALVDGVVVAVAHDEFRGVRLSGVSGFLGAGAVRVDVGDD